ncbi:hypothetical protein ACFUTV_38990 [Streptomyces sp. NPDC057298]|uniref:hypothetical protein n=1 Tax=Streptomyces sp. NPDC057298 TaxID=3346091 RepID=UPI003628D492
MIDTKGTPTSFVIAGDRSHEFSMPRDLAVLPEKVAKAYQRLVDARAAEQKASAKNNLNYPAMKAANDAVRDALHELYDTAAATSTAARQQYSEQYEYGLRRYERAIADAQAALQDVVTAVQLHDQAARGHGVGLKPGTGTKPVMIARVLSESLETLPALPALEA